MDHLKMAPSVVRASRIKLLLASGLILSSLTGCKHHQRTVMRPAFTTSPTLSPALASPGCSNCGSGSGTTGGTISTQPDSSEPFLSPAPPATGSTRSDPGLRRSGGPAAVPSEATEPPLNVPDTGPGPAPAGASTTGAGPELVRPSASRSTGRRASSPRRDPRVSLRDAVVPYVANADDLFQPPKADRPWKYVVLHHSANASGGYDQIDRDHRKILGFEGCGYHFVIGNGTDSPDGQIEIAERWLNQKQGVHCRNGKTPDVNEYGVGICLVGNFDQTEPTPRQVAAARALVAYLGDRYAIAPDHLGTHDQFASGPTACPGKNFPADAILGPKHMANR